MSAVSIKCISSDGIEYSIGDICVSSGCKDPFMVSGFVYDSTATYAVDSKLLYNRLETCSKSIVVSCEYEETRNAIDFLFGYNFDPNITRCPLYINVNSRKEVDNVSLFHVISFDQYCELKDIKPAFTTYDGVRVYNPKQTCYSVSKDGVAISKINIGLVFYDKDKAKEYYISKYPKPLFYTDDFKDGSFPVKSCDNCNIRENELECCPPENICKKWQGDLKGEPIYSGSICYQVSKYGIGRGKVNVGSFHGIKYFSNRTNAEIYYKYKCLKKDYLELVEASLLNLETHFINPCTIDIDANNLAAFIDKLNSANAKLFSEIGINTDSTIEPVKPVLMTSFDGIPLYEGDTFYMVDITKLEFVHPYDDKTVFTFTIAKDTPIYTTHLKFYAIAKALDYIIGKKFIPNCWYSDGKTVFYYNKSLTNGNFYGFINIGQLSPIHDYKGTWSDTIALTQYNYGNFYLGSNAIVKSLLNNEAYNRYPLRTILKNFGKVYNNVFVGTFDGNINVYIQDILCTKKIFKSTTGIWDEVSDKIIVGDYVYVDYSKTDSLLVIKIDNLQELEDLFNKRNLMITRATKSQIKEYLTEIHGFNLEKVLENLPSCYKD